MIYSVYTYIKKQIWYVMLYIIIYIYMYINMYIYIYVLKWVADIIICSL